MTARQPLWARVVAAVIIGIVLAVVVGVLLGLGVAAVSTVWGWVL